MYVEIYFVNCIKEREKERERERERENVFHAFCEHEQSLNEMTFK